MKVEPIVAECNNCGAKLTLAQTRQVDPDDDCCPRCFANDLIFLLNEEDLYSDEEFEREEPH